MDHFFGEDKVFSTVLGYCPCNVFLGECIFLVLVMFLRESFQLLPYIHVASRTNLSLPTVLYNRTGLALSHKNRNGLSDITK